MGITVTGTVLAATELRGFLCVRYDITPPNLLKTRQLLSVCLHISQT